VFVLASHCSDTQLSLFVISPWKIIIINGHSSNLVDADIVSFGWVFAVPSKRNMSFYRTGKFMVSSLEEKRRGRLMVERQQPENNKKTLNKCLENIFIFIFICDNAKLCFHVRLWFIRYLCFLMKTEFKTWNGFVIKGTFLPSGSGRNINLIWLCGISTLSTPFVSSPVEAMTIHRFAGRNWSRVQILLAERDLSDETWFINDRSMIEYSFLPNKIFVRTFRLQGYS
jgi:hypothetical protein